MERFKIDQWILPLKKVSCFFLLPFSLLLLFYLLLICLWHRRFITPRDAANSLASEAALAYTALLAVPNTAAGPAALAALNTAAAAPGKNTKQTLRGATRQP